MPDIFRAAGSARPLIRASTGQRRHSFPFLDDYQLFARIQPRYDFAQVGLGIVNVHCCHNSHLSPNDRRVLCQAIPMTWVSLYLVPQGVGPACFQGSPPVAAVAKERRVTPPVDRVLETRSQSITMPDSLLRLSGARSA